MAGFPSTAELRSRASASPLAPNPLRAIVPIVMHLNLFEAEIVTQSFTTTAPHKIGLRTLTNNAQVGPQIRTAMECELRWGRQSAASS
jgi:hypothetical protein